MFLCATLAYTLCCSYKSNFMFVILGATLLVIILVISFLASRARRKG